MLTLNDGRKELYQWDTGRAATVDIDCDIVHFANLKYGESLAVEVKGGEVSVPNKLLMSGEPIYCWAFVKDESGTYTKKEQALAVTKRAKPSDYVYTETEVITIKTAVENALEEAKESGDFKGDKGDKGDDGYTPQKGVDYFTPEDIAELNIPSVDKIYNPASENAQSGKAVAEAVAQFAAEILQPEVNQIKDDLSNKLPKSPTDWQEWTAEEQAEARERIGIGGDWEYIDEITLSEEAGLDITLNRDYKKIYMFAEKPSGTSFEGETRLYFHDKNNSGWAEIKGANIQSSFSDDYTQILAECCGKLSFIAKMNSDWTYGYGANPSFAVNTGSTDCVINHICTFACILPAGFSIKIWGVPA